jgi:hypothetical protein
MHTVLFFCCELQQAWHAPKAAGHNIDTVTAAIAAAVLANGSKQKLLTSYTSTIVTVARLELAVQCGLNMAAMCADEDEFARDVLEHSIDFETVLALSKLYDMKWSSALCNWAALNSNLNLLQWLHLHKCPWDVDTVTQYAGRQRART